MEHYGKSRESPKTKIQEMGLEDADFRLDIASSWFNPEIFRTANASQGSPWHPEVTRTFWQISVNFKRQRPEHRVGAIEFELAIIDHSCTEGVTYIYNYIYICTSLFDCHISIYVI